MNKFLIKLILVLKVIKTFNQILNLIQKISIKKIIIKKIFKNKTQQILNS